jgi:predicted Zn finger-like uncharacterized protein
MYTQCSDCLTIYKVQIETLQSSLGKFRCGHCGGVFDAIPTLTEVLPNGPVEELPRAASVDTPVVLSVPAMRPVRQDALFQAHAAEPVLQDDEIDLDRLFDAPSTRKEPTMPAQWLVYTPGDEAPIEQSSKARYSSSAPVEMSQAAQRAVDKLSSREQRYRAEAKQFDAERAAKRNQSELGKISVSSSAARVGPTNSADKAAHITNQAQAASPTQNLYAPASIVSDEPETSRWPWRFGSVLLCLVLLGQLGYYQRASLLAHDDFRPWLDRGCALLGCTLPLREDLQRLRLLDGGVRKHEAAASALIVNASLRNDANFVQAFPIVEVKLLSPTNQVIALRRFAPEHYLSDAAGIPEGIPAGAILPIVFEVLDPGKTATGFEFNFLSSARGVQTSP